MEIMIQVGSRLSYRDAGTPKRVGKVVGFVADGAQARIEWADGGVSCAPVRVIRAGIARGAAAAGFGWA